MTARLLLEACLIELNKKDAPSLPLLDYNYYINKAVYQYANKEYNIYDTSQQTSDNLRVLKDTAILDAKKIVNNYGSLTEISKYITGASSLFGARYEIELPKDYLHMLNCVCIYRLNKRHKCWDYGNYVEMPARRLTADAWSKIINDLYQRPTPERPYYYVHNLGDSSNYPYNSETDMIGTYKVEPGLKEETNISDDKILAGEPELKEKTQTEGTNFNRVILFGDEKNPNKISTIERETGYRYGNPSSIRCEIRYGKDDSVFVLEKVFIDYIKTPLTIRLTLEQIDLTEDTSQILEFPDYVCDLIVNELVRLVMENSMNLRLLTHTAVTLSIANPAQQLAQSQPQQGG